MIVEFVSTLLPAFYNLLPRVGYNLTGDIGTVATAGISSFSVLSWVHPQGKGVLILCICCLQVMGGLTGRFGFLEKGCRQLSTILPVAGGQVNSLHEEEYFGSQIQVQFANSAFLG